MKKTALLLISLCMILSLAACASQSKPDQSQLMTDPQQTQTADIPDETDGNVPDGAVDVDGDDQDFYYVATSYSKKEVEDFAAGVRANILDKDWKALSEKMCFPVNVNGEEVKTAEDFVSLMNGMEISDDFYKAVESETCKDMSANSHGIMFGSGEVWIAEYLDNADDEKGQLYVISLNL